MRRKIALGATATVLTAGGVAAGTGVGLADEVWGFRLSNFGASIATVCVITDRQTQCTGRIARGVSRVYDVAFSDPGSFRCVANPDFTSDVTSRYFNRNEFKECIYWSEGDISGQSNKKLIAKRPDGTETQIS